MRIAIIGDPHFEVLSEANTQSSFIKLDASGNFINQSATENPWIGLGELIGQSGKNIDALICAGDMTVKANGAGLKKAWEELLALGSQIGAIHTISATGNHDVLSRTNNDIRANPVRGMSETKGVFEPLKCVFQPSVTTHFRQMTGHFRVSVTACFRFSVTAFVLSSEMRFA